MTSSVHPLFGRLLLASGFKRHGGVLFLVVLLPDGSPGTIPVAATDILGVRTGWWGGDGAFGGGDPRVARAGRVVEAVSAVLGWGRDAQIGSTNPVRANGQER